MISKEATNRIINLDILRGLMALGIMVYHNLYWHNFSKDYNLLINKIGLYGVSIFYILSGITFFLVYKKSNFLDLKTLKSFWIKRFFRIFPLFWLVSIVTLIVSKTNYNIYTIFLNFTGLFSIINPSAEIPVGGWSIGNELFFYIFFPGLLLILQKSKLFFFATIYLSFFIFVYFAFFKIDSDISLIAQWSKYINPFNQLFFFVSGINIGFIYKNYEQKNIYIYAILVILSLVFAFLPIKFGEGIELISNWNRLILSFVCIGFTYFFIQVNLPANIIFNKLKTLGEISYSVYLVHPLIYFASFPFFRLLERYFHVLPLFKVSLLVSTSIFVSWFIFFNFEKKFIEMGNRILTKP